MKKIWIILLTLLSICIPSVGQEIEYGGEVSTLFNSQLSERNGYWSAEYKPELTFNYTHKSSFQIDAIVSALLSGEASSIHYNRIQIEEDLELYRAWVRMLWKEHEVRVGRQILNFGVAQLLRPLMWYDELDPRDPLSQSRGVDALLYRYTHPQDHQLWLWGIYPDQRNRGWDMLPNKSEHIQWGGRGVLSFNPIQGGLNYMTRKIDVPDYNLHSREHRWGIDLYANTPVGLWAEGSMSHFTKSEIKMKNQFLATIGADYLFDIGYGLYAIMEHMYFQRNFYAGGGKSYDYISAFSLSYPLGNRDKLTAWITCSWTEKNVYSYLQWEHLFKNVGCYIVAYANPRRPDRLPFALIEGENALSGFGLSFQIVWAH